MDDPWTNSAAPLDPRSTQEPSAGSVHEMSQLSPLLPLLSPKSEDGFADWETIGERRDFYDEQDFLNPSYSLASEKLKNRKEDDVVIFDYSIDPDYLSRLDGNPPVEGGGPSLGRFSGDTGRFFRAPKDRLVESKQFNQVINPTKDPRLAQSLGPRLGIIDFPQCYDTYDDSLLNSIGEKLGLLREGETACMDAYSQRVRALPGRGRFRTGISLRASFREPFGPPKSGSSEDGFILFVSFPYFGESSKNISLDPETESIKLLDFKGLGVEASNCNAVVSKERDDIAKITVEKGETLVHQARYMIFDNYTMATFRSKEDSAKDQVPLHYPQKCISAFDAMVHMIANRMYPELYTLGKLQASLCKLEEDINQMISDAKTYEDNQGMERIPDHEPQLRGFWRRLPSSLMKKQKSSYPYERARQNRVHKCKQRRVRDLLTSLNSLSAALFAAIAVAERQTVVLLDLRKMLLASCQTEATSKNHEERYPPHRSPSYKRVPGILTPLKYPEQEWRNILGTINEMVQERKSFIQKIKELVENMDIRGEILFGFLASTAKERVEDTPMQLVETQSFPGFLEVSLAFIPLNFCTSYYGMNLKEWDGNKPSKLDFLRLVSISFFGVSGIIFFAGAVFFAVHRVFSRFSKKNIYDIESQL
ncbi:hypothetical protein B9Z19DRAFT_1190015 [Tuber borchii]|uniref:Uncharacterized protein n=1 Tax=Tuber borchii TaxID=42251 RepID=A0A2T7A5E5_TUBBO|nr:hypothetical protein B9Z19DRAFT_1190015 [Tuber borchii]